MSLPDGVKATTGGTFDRDADPIYFLATSPGTMHGLTVASPEPRLAEHVLVAVNELESASTIEELGRTLDSGAKVLMDSGVFALSTGHAKVHGLTMDQALSLAPDEIDGFDRLYDRYCSLVERFRDRLWGVIEIDQGGAVNKRLTRARLEADLPGFVPMPVYHPLNDGWDYFDEVAGSYDRICCGNVVQANVALRTRLLATFYERAAVYPYLWIHVLGYTPTGTTSSVPPQGSCDSSSWLTSTRWLAADKLRAMLHPWTRLRTDDRFTYERGLDPGEAGGQPDAVRLNAYRAKMTEASWHAIRQERRDRGLLVQDLLPGLLAEHDMEVH